MKDEVKSKAQLIRELGDLRARVAALEADCRQAETAARTSEKKDKVVSEHTPEAIQKILLEKLRKYEFIANASREFMTLINRDYIYEAVNDAYCNAHGKARDEILGRTIFDIWGEERSQMDIVPYLEKCFSGDAVQSQSWFNFSDKDQRCYEVNYYPYFQKKDIVTHVVVVTHDITEKTLAERELKKNEERYRRLVELSPDAIIIHRKGRIVYSNNAGAKLVGAKDPKQLIGSSVLDFSHPDDREIVKKRIWEIRRDKSEVHLTEEKLVKLDGTVIHVEVAAIPFTYQGNPAVQLVARDITDRGEAEKALRKSQTSLAEAQRIAKLGNWDWDILKNDLHWSDEIYRIFGLAPQAFGATYESFLHSVHPGDRERVKAAVDDALYKKEPLSIDHRIVLVDGSERIVHEQADVSFNRNGKPIRMIGTMQDITESKRVYMALKSRAKQQAVIAELGQYALTAHNLSELMDKIVERTARCLEVEYCKILELMPQGDALLMRAGVGWKDGFVGRAMVGAKADSQAGYTLLSKNPVIVEDLRTETRFSGSKLLHDHGVISGMSVIIHGRDRPFGVMSVHTTKPRSFSEDETHFFQTAANMLSEAINRKRAEEQLQESKAMLQSVFDGISDPLIMMDENLSVQMLNKAAMELYQISRIEEELTCKCCFEAIRGKTDPCPGCGIPSAVLSGEAKTFEQQGFWHSDPDRLYQVVIYPLSSGKCTISGAIIRISDITESRQRERRIMQSEKLVSLGLLVSGIAHEINNPNSFITLNVPILREYLKEIIPIIDDHVRADADFEVLRMPYPEFREDIFKLLNNMEHGSQRINDIISGLTEFVRKGPKDDRRPIDVKEVIERGIVICRGKIIKSIKSFEVNIPGRLPPISTDPDALEQILINLLINAAQSIDKEDSWLKLKVKLGEPFQNHIIIQVSDNGCGMDSETVQRIFDPFFTTKGIGTGTGLGLYVCHNLVEGLGGRIEVESEPGKGSCFRVILPTVERRKQNRYT